jgi:hypothetical protein
VGLDRSLNIRSCTSARTESAADSQPYC